MGVAYTPLVAWPATPRPLDSAAQFLQLLARQAQVLTELRSVTTRQDRDVTMLLTMTLIWP